MRQKIKKVISFCLALMLLVTGLPVSGEMQQVQAEATGEVEYEIYPIPQSITYGEGVADLADSLNVVLESGLDEATVKRMGDILTMKNITLSDVQSDNIVEGKTNIVVGIQGSGGVADTFFDSIDYESTLFEEIDSYILYIQDNTIAILGRDTDAAFWGLTTLKLIVKQLTGTQIRELRIDDYSDAQFRGFIEGYYGIPWTDEDRISLMEFGGDFKMNTYIFAPKDDAYHSSMWATLYPKERLEEMREMVEAGNNSKCKFVWSIHPFRHNKITADDYDEKLEIIKAKFEQLYSIGVRQFGILADDASSDVAIQNQLCKDMDAWCKEKGDVYDLVFVPQQYNKGWTTVEDGRAPYFDALMEGMPESVQIMWTGDGVCGWVTQSTFDWFEEKVGREAFMWLNWPVNDINSKRLLMGKGEILGEGVTGFTGILTNPMQQAEASKVSLFAVADYTWNRDAFDDDKSWADSFKYIDEGASEALYTMAQHLCDPAPNGHGLVLEESEALAPYLSDFQTALNAGDSIVELGEYLVGEFDKIAEAADTYRANATNANLLKEMEPWISSLKDLAVACSEYLKAAIAVEQGENDKIWGHYSTATASYETSKTYQVKNLNNFATVEAGYKRLIPFAEFLAEAVEADVKEVVSPSGNVGETTESTTTNISVIQSGLESIYDGNVNNIIDGNDTTYVWFGSAAAADSYIGVDLGEVISVGSIRVLQGTSDTSNDIMSSAVLEYSEDGTTYTQLETYTSTRVIEKDLSDNAIQARYVRIRAAANGSNWFSMREFTVTEAADNSGAAYTNLDNAAFDVEITADTAVLTTSAAVNLGQNEYIGIKLPRIRDLSAITGTITNGEQLTVETSMNGKEWSTVALPENEPEDARYIRIINKNAEAVSVNVTELRVTSNEIKDIAAVNSTFDSMTTPENLFDGDYGTQGIFMSSQTAGFQVTYDLGQTININSIKMVTNDNENDYLRNGKISLSMDGTNWTDVLFIGNQTTDQDIADIYVYEGGYRVKATENMAAMDARYLKLEITKTKDGDNKWTRVQEIVLNDGAYIPTENNPTFVSSATEAAGMPPTNLIDENITTAYQPDVAQGEAGYIIYRLSENTDISQINILQNPNTISNAKVSVRYGEHLWEEIGTLAQSLNVFNNLSVKFDNIYEIKIEWDEIAPVLYEIYLMSATEDIAVESIALSESYISMDQGSSRQLTATILPENAGNSTLKWSTSDASVVTVSENGLLTAHNIGTAIVTVSSARYPVSQKCFVVVNYVDSLKMSTKGMTATTCDYQSGNEPKYVLDGNADTIWHSNWTNGTDALPHWISIELAEAEFINKITYLPRQEGGSNGIVTGYSVIVTKPDGTEETVVDAGTWADDTTEKVVSFEKIEAKSVKLEITAAHGDFGSAAEIGIYRYNPKPEDSDIPEGVDKTALENAIAEAEAKVETAYTVESWKAFQTVLTAVKAVAETENAADAAIYSAKTELDNAVEGLVEAGIVTPLNGTIAEAETKTEADYTVNSWNTLRRAKAAAEKAIADRASQDDIDAAKAALENAIAALVAVGNPEELKTSIIVAEEITGADKYTANSWGALQAAITAAQEAVAGRAMQDDLDAAKAALEAAVAALVNIAELKASIETAEAKVETAYTVESWNALQTALAAAEEIAGKADATQAEVDEAKAALDGKVTALVAAGDAQALNELLTTAKEKTEADYTTDSWVTLQNAITEAEEAVTGRAAQDDLNAVKAALEAAIAALVNIAELKASIETAEAKVETAYTVESWNALQTALAAAEGIAEKADATQEEVDDAQTALDGKVTALVAAGDAQALNELLTTAKEKTEADYTTDSWATLQNAITEAEEAVTGRAAQDDLNTVKAALEAAIAGLETLGDKTALASAIAAAEALNTAEYTADSWAALQTALTAAKAVNADRNALQADIDAAKAALEAAVTALVKVTTTPGGNTTTPGGNTTTPGGNTTTPGGNTTTPGDTTKPEDTTTPPADTTPEVTAPAQGTKFVNKGATYKITKADLKNGEVAFVSPKKNAKKVTVPATVKYEGITYKVTSIEKNAFKKNKKVTNVTIGANVKTIGVSAFEGCTKLSKVTIGKNVTKIGDKAFKGCKALKSITVPSKVTSIGKEAFSNCSKLSKITIKSSKLKSVGKNAFKGIKSNAKISVPKKKVASYKKMFKKAGVSKKVKITK